MPEAKTRPADYAFDDGTDPEVWKNIREAADTVFENTVKGNSCPDMTDSVTEEFVRGLVSKGMTEARARALMDFVRTTVFPMRMSHEEVESLGPVEGSHGKIYVPEFRPVRPPEKRMTFFRRMLSRWRGRKCQE